MCGVRAQAQIDSIGDPGAPASVSVLESVSVFVLESVLESASAFVFVLELPGS